MRFRGVARVVGFAALVGSTAGCWLLPDDGYDKVMYRDRSPLTTPAAIEPPPLVAGLGAGSGDLPQLAAGAPADVTQDMVEAGAQQYGTLCAACHGAAGAGTAAGPALNDGAWLHISGSFDELVSVITTGVSTPVEFAAPMPPMGGGNFSPEEVRQLAAYVFALNQAP